MKKKDTHAIYEVKLNSPQSVQLPDDFSYKPGATPPDDFIITYDRDSKPLSRYGDAVWDMTAYQRRLPTTILNFHSWIDSNMDGHHQVIVNDMKWVIFITLYFSTQILAVSTLMGRLTLLKHMARFCHPLEIKPTDLLSNPIKFVEFVDTVKFNDSVTTLAAMINDIHSIGQKKSSITLLTGISRHELKKLSSDVSKSSKQHPVIPTRIYSSLIEEFMYEILRFEEASEPFLSLVKTCALDGLSGRNKGTQKETHKKNGVAPSIANMKPELDEMIEVLGLRDYFNEIKERHGFEITRLRNIARWITNIQWICNQIVHIFSGMRDSEANRLPFSCLETPVHNRKKHYRIIGETTKLEDEISKPARWVTCEQAATAITVAQKIAEVIYQNIGVDDLKSTSKSHSTDYPLFIGTGYLGFTPRASKSQEAPYASAKMGKTQLINTWIPTITIEDIAELESIDPFRDWHTEKKFLVGQPWPLTDHQYRRSLAVYASASGMVSLPSLRQQLQHITEEMTVYYAKGSAYAKDLVQDHKDHFYHDYQAQQPESQALAYIAQVLLSAEPIFGAHGTWVDRRFQRDEPISKADRKETIDSFKRGELAYKSTPLGGCTTVEPCDKKAMRSVVGCLECSKAVIKLTKLDRVIRVQEAFLSRLEPDSIAAQAKKDDLAELAKYRIKIQDKQEVAGG